MSLRPACLHREFEASYSCVVKPEDVGGRRGGMARGAGEYTETLGQDSVVLPIAMQ